MQKQIIKKVFKGTVIKTAMKDTAVVLVERYVKHSRYAKFINLRKKFKVHDPGNNKKVGEKVAFVACKPISKTKSFRFVEMA